MNVISKWLKGIKEDSLSQNQMVMKYDFPEIYIARKAIFRSKYGYIYIMPSGAKVYSYTDNRGNYAVFTDEFLRTSFWSMPIHDTKNMCLPNDEDLEFARWLYPCLIMGDMDYHYRTESGRVYCWSFPELDPVMILIENAKSWCFCSQRYVTTKIAQNSIVSRFAMVRS